MTTEKYSGLSREELISRLIGLEMAVTRIQGETNTRLEESINELRLIQRDYWALKRKIELGISVDL